MFYYRVQSGFWEWEVQFLTEMDDVRSINWVVRSWARDMGRRTIHDRTPRIDPLLIRLLLRLEPKDAYLLNERSRGLLNDELGGGNAPLVFAILKAWKQVGDGRAIRYVKPLAQGKRLAARNEKIRAAAQECLPVLRARAELEEWLALTR